MRRLMLALALVASLSGCATAPGTASGSGRSTIERVQDATDRTFAAIERMLPLFGAEAQLRARAVMAAITLALGVAREATTPAGREAALIEVETQTAALSGIAAQEALK